MVALTLLIIAVTGLAICMSFFLSEIISIILALITFLMSLVLIITASSALLIVVLLMLIKNLASMFLFLIF